MKMETNKLSRWVSVLWLVPAVLASDLLAEEERVPRFEEVLQLLRANLPEVTETELNRAIVQGLVDRFQPAVQLVPTNTVEVQEAGGPWITTGALYDSNVGYLRVRAVGPGLAAELGSRWSELRSTNQVEALILDLRFAVGQEYEEAARAADLFVRGEKPLLAWDDTVIRSTGAGGSFLPLAILVNGETRGAAEAMAAALRETGTALIVGAQTAGQAYVYREFPLDGRVLRIASLPVMSGEGRSLTGGVRPDIEARVPIEQERVYYADPFGSLPGEPVVSRSNRPRLTEAELVRRQRGESSFDPAATERGAIPVTGLPEAGQLRDPALVQAVDILKGIIIVGPVSPRD